MKRLLFFVALAGIIAVIPGFWGCTTDDNPTGSTDSTIAPVGADVVEGLFEDGSVNMSYMQAMIALNLTDQILAGAGKSPMFKPGPTSADSGSFHVVINSQTVDGDWFVLTISAVIINEGDDNSLDTLYFEGTDSLRFSNSSGYTIMPDTNITAINSRSHHSARALMTSDSANAGSHNAFDFTIGLDDTLTISGTAHDTLTFYKNSDSANCVFETTTNQTWSSIVLTQAVIDDDECPPSGNLSLGATLSVDCSATGGIDTVSIDGSWTVTMAFDNGIQTTTFNSGNFHWTAIDTCGSSNGGGGGGGEEDTTGVTFDTSYVSAFQEYVDGDKLSGGGSAFRATMSALYVYDTTLNVFGEGDPPVDPSTIDWICDSGSGWFIFTFNINDTSSYTRDTGTGSFDVYEYETITAVDSIMFFDNGTIQSSPNASTDSLHANAHWIASSTNSLGEMSSEVGHHSTRSIGTPWGQTQLEVYDIGADTNTSTSNMYYGGTNNVCTLTVKSTSVMSNVVVPTTIFASEDGCPLSGTSVATANIEWSCGFVYGNDGYQYDLDGLWNVSENFNGSTITSTYGYNGHSVTVIDSCGD